MVSVPMSAAAVRYLPLMTGVSSTTGGLFPLALALGLLGTAGWEVDWGFSLSLSLMWAGLIAQKLLGH
jgi:hypothetical protein